MGLVWYIFAALNILTFFVYAYDKFVAGGKRRRIPEVTLWLLALLGGSVGTLVGMYTFRHKTRKVSFQLVLAFIICIQCIFFIFLDLRNP